MDKIAKIEKIQSLLDAGSISKEEFNKLKEDIMSTSNEVGQQNVSNKKDESPNVNSSNKFPIPLLAGWIINAAAWVLFAATFNPGIELIMGVLCAGCVFIGYKHKQLNTPPSDIPFIDIDNGYLTPQNLMYTSAFEALWMFAWAFA
tara:strand:- start:286 stop:723 length:438 start_codon:yes stop_codon:yes gene_type:complete